MNTNTVTYQKRVELDQDTLNKIISLRVTWLCLCQHDDDDKARPFLELAHRVELEAGLRRESSCGSTLIWIAGDELWKKIDHDSRELYHFIRDTYRSR